MLPRRLGAYSPAWLDELCTGGEVVWVGAGALGRSGGKVALYFREDVRLAGPPPAKPSSSRRRARATTRSASCSAGGPASGSTWSTSSTSRAEELHTALWDLAWAGEVTNDAFAPLRRPAAVAPCRVREQRGQALRGPPRRRPARPCRAGGR